MNLCTSNLIISQAQSGKHPEKNLPLLKSDIIITLGCEHTISILNLIKMRSYLFFRFLAVIFTYVKLLVQRESRSAIYQYIHCLTLLSARVYKDQGYTL